MEERVNPVDSKKVCLKWIDLENGEFATTTFIKNVKYLCVVYESGSWYALEIKPVTSNDKILWYKTKSIDDAMNIADLVIEYKKNH